MHNVPIDIGQILCIMCPSTYDVFADRPEMLDGIGHVQILVLNHANIQGLEMGTFHDFNMLEDLQLNDNPNITTVPDGWPVPVVSNCNI